MANFDKMQAPPQRLCNCRVPANCPLGNRCLTESVVYKASISATGTVQENKFYLGLTANSMKQRISSHNTSFRNERYRDQTSLSSYIWHLKDLGADYTIRWSVVRHAQAHRAGDKICSLCLAEKLAILHGSSTAASRFRTLGIRSASTREMSCLANADIGTGRSWLPFCNVIFPFISVTKTHQTILLFHNHLTK